MRMIESPNLKKQQMAIALAYAENDSAPKVVAKGRGVIAEQIIKKANENKVFVHQSKELVSLLMQLDLDDHIPPALYQAIAEVLAWLYQLENGLNPAPLKVSKEVLPEALELDKFK